MLGEVADQMFGHLFALSDVIETVPPAARLPAAEEALAATASAVAVTARGIAAATEAERHAAPVEVGWRGETVRAALTREAVGEKVTDEFANYRHAAEPCLDRAAQYAGVAAATVAGLNRGVPADAVARPLEVEDPESRPPLLAPVGAGAGGRLRRPTARVARRPGHGGCRGVGRRLGLERGYWVTLTAVIILQPYTGATDATRPGAGARHRPGWRADGRTGGAVSSTHSRSWRSPSCSRASRWRCCRSTMRPSRSS